MQMTLNNVRRAVHETDNIRTWIWSRIFLILPLLRVAKLADDLKGLNMESQIYNNIFCTVLKHELIENGRETKRRHGGVMLSQNATNKIKR